MEQQRIAKDTSSAKPPVHAPLAANVEHVATAIARGISHLESIQRPEGCIVGEVVWCPMLTAQYVMTAYMTGQTIPEERRARFLKYFEVWQTEDGGWGMHAESPAYLFVTSLVYVAMRLMGVAADDPMAERGLRWIRSHGGVTRLPSWGKAWLAMLRLYDWDGVSPVLPELWLQPDFSPVHPRRMYCHTRLIYLGLGYLYGVRYETDETQLLATIRDELWDEPFESVKWKQHMFDLAETDLFEAPHPVLKGVYGLCGLYDKVHPGKLRAKALELALEQILHHQRESRYAAISPVNGLLNTLALHHAGHPDMEPSFRGVDYWVWVDDEEGERFNGAHSHTWDTSFAVQAVCDGPAAPDFPRFLEKAASYLRGAQMKEDVPHRRHFYRDQLRGGFCFSDHHHRWPVSDCTGEALSAISHLSEHVDPSLLPAPDLIAEAGRFLLTRQNDDGGWGSYERQRGGMFLERFNPSEMFGNCMVEHSYVECTASCMEGLRQGLDRFSHLLSTDDVADMRTAIDRGAALLRRTQLDDGSWPGFWGVNYTYGTLFGVVGLLAAGATGTDPAIRRACRWVVDARLGDGGWGESYTGCVEERYVPAPESQVIQTSWALMTLLRADYDGPGAREAIDEGLRILVERQLPDGDWPKEGVGGVFFNTAMHHYCLYKNYFPLWALGLAAARGL